jgi:alkylation response protein AidB-like acyl-CoA dehydrogenase
LALGVAERSLRFLIEESQKRSGLAATVEALLGRTESVRAMMKRAVQQGRSEDRAPLRVAANSVALDTTHAALVVAKGAGYVRTHPVAQWCQQALFFLVWSCPAAVLEGQLLDFAGVVPVGERET